MKARIAALIALLLAGGCATAPAPPATDSIFNDAAFARPSGRIDAADVFAVNDAMRRYVHEDIASQLVAKGKAKGLFDALYSSNQLKLEYDSALTRNAAEAFESRSGNCLSLIIMTAALAKELGLEVRFQQMSTE